MTQPDPKLVARYFLRETMGLVVMGVALFVSAGRLDWWPGWAVILVMLLWTVATAVVILRNCPELLAERLGPRRGAKPWDMAILGILGLTQLARYVLAGLDLRYHWTGGFPLAAQIAGLLVCALGYALFVWATASNAYFSQTVRIQNERGHRVVSGGPYGFVRHPGYLGALAYELGAGVLLGSWWALLVSLLNVGLLALRTALEDRTLRTELPGYEEYTGRVRYRLLPQIW